MRSSWPLAAACLAAATISAAGCGAATARHGTRQPSPAETTATAPPASASSTAPSPAPPASRPPSTAAQTAAAAPANPPATSALVGTRLGALEGHTVVIDPGHDGGNAAHPGEINRQVPDGVGTKACDTTGTETGSGYPEHAFTWDVALRLAAVLRAQGAVPVLTRSSDQGVGPCVDQRAATGNQYPSAVAVSIHADGGPSSARGFHVIRPAGIVGLNDAIVGPSSLLATAISEAYAAGTGEPAAGYVGASGGVVARNDLAGLNLSKIPKVFIECLNMRESSDAARAADPAYRQRVAEALAAGLAGYFSR